LTTAEIKLGLTTDQIASLTTAQVAALTTAQISQGFSTAQIAALTTDDVVAMRTAQIAALTTAQISLGLSTDQLSSLTTAEIVALTTSQIASITTTQIQSLTTAELAAMTTNQTLHGLTSAQIHALTTTQFVAINFEQHRRAEALTSHEVAALSTPAPVAKTSLRQRVGTLVNAMASFDSESVSATPVASKIAAELRPETATLAIASSVSNIVEELKRFDINGNPLAKPGEAAASDKRISMTGMHETGYLAIPPK
jgi:hypothetical protein